MNRLFAILIVLLCAGCAAPPKPTIDQLDMATIESRPDFISAVGPPEYSVITLALYNYTPQGSVGHSIGDVSDGFKRSICVRPFMERLVQKGDFWPEDSEIWTRMDLLVNDAPMEPYGAVMRSMLAFPREHHVLHGTVWIEGADYCWQAPLETGLHKVTFQFQQTSGDVQSYTWYFEITK